MSSLPRRLACRLPAWTITAALGCAYLIAAPPSPDLAAASYRSELFAHVGFSLWDNSWYGGHHLLAYSVLAPPLGALIGPRLLAAVSMTVAAALFARLIDGRFPARAARIGAVWFAFGVGVALLSSRVPFNLGLAIGLGALLLAQRQRMWAALALSVLTSLASPVAGAFLALAWLAWAIAARSRAWPAVLCVVALAPIALLTLAFPEGGTQPFVASAFYPPLLAVLVVALLIPPEQRLLRIGSWLYALALVGAYVLPSAVGGNVDRLGALTAGPVAACALAASTRGRRRALILIAPFLLYWQLSAPVADLRAASSDAASAASYYAPLLAEMHSLGIGYGARPVRIEVVPTVDHWEARWVAPHAMLARGWERQLDVYRNHLFYGDTPLTPARYRTWLAHNGISYIALPDPPLDYSATDEARLLRNGAPANVREVWRGGHWRLFAVTDATPLVSPPGVLTSVSSDSLTLYAPRPGRYTALVRFTPYWALASGSGCVSRSSEGWTQIRARRPGRLRLVIDFSLARMVQDGPRCR